MTSTKKRVRFPVEDESIAIIVCTIPNREDYIEEDHGLLFFSRGDYHISRSSAKMISRESERYGFSKNLEETYKEKSKAAQDSLNQWTSRGDSRRGLERWANRKHGDARQQDQFQSVMAVLRAQDDMLAARKGIDHEQIRKVSHKATKIARHFARMMGKADSHALASELTESDDQVADDITITTSGMSSVALSEDSGGVDVKEDLMKDSHHERSSSKRTLFGFGRKNRVAREKTIDGTRCSRVA
jgi:hypothetical protein